MTEAEMKAWINAATYPDLLEKCRYAPSGDPFFQGEVGKYFSLAMVAARTEVGDEAHTAISKKLGWK